MSVDGSDVEHHATFKFNAEEIIGQNFLTHIDSQGHRIRIRIADVLEHEQKGSKASTAKTRFPCMATDDNTYYDILTYERDMDMGSSEDNAKEIVWRFKSIIGHNGPIPFTHPDCKGSSWNVLMEWETGEITTEPLSLIAQDDPVTCALYARDNDLLDTPGSKQR
jgi:hypothetical protein